VSLVPISVNKTINILVAVPRSFYENDFMPVPGALSQCQHTLMRHY
jgi:hypothetical protein